ncbi:uncharacterized protein LOC143288574 isoform X2 [Babylonia areolata]|uniref:uncharacterized protein LOC143288574 isoform X2 n=1 Tax=Babylonia areolata TaxID=304850 RepID=UPI003FD0883A
MVRWWITAVVVMVMGASGPAVAQASSQSSTDKGFKHDVDLQEPETGQEFVLHSKGRVASMVELDKIPQVKRVACVGDRLIVRMTDTTPARDWRVGQVVVGGPEWGCNATHHNGFRAQAIYVKLVTISFPLDSEVAMHHTQAGPFDMVEEANIYFHYDPGLKTHPSLTPSSLAEKKHRFRRSLSNIVSNILDHIDWSANLSATLPFTLGPSDRGESSNGSEPLTLALHKSWGQKNLTVTRGQSAQEVKDDFVLLVDSLDGESELTYTFDLVIRNVDGAPQIVKYINQYDLQTSLEADARVSVEQEMGVTFNVTLGRSPTQQQLLRVPLIRPRGGDPPLPPVYLTVTYSSVSMAAVSAYSAGKGSVSTAFNASGFVTASQKLDPVTKLGSDATSRDWSVETQKQNLRSPYRTHVDFSIYQKLFFSSAVSWHYNDVDIELSPPMEVTVRPEVRIRSSSLGLSRCVSSSVTVDAHIHMGRADFRADAFGLHLWDIPLQPGMTRDLHLIDGDLGQGCDARCHGPSHVTGRGMNASQQMMVPFGRQDAAFNRLRAFTGNQVHFHDPAASATWCGAPGTPCHPCSPQHATTNTPALMTCATRLMTSRAVAALTVLADLVSSEWPDRTLQVLEAWDEPTSEQPAGAHGEQSLHKAGRALALGLGDSVTGAELERLAQLAVCAGFELVELLLNETKVEVGVAEDGWSEPDPEQEERKSDFWDGMKTLDVSGLWPSCSKAPVLTEGDTWPQGDPVLRCGPANRPLHRGHRDHMDSLIHWNLNEASLTFEAEGQATEWCGYPSRPCRDTCDTISDDLEPWSWCSTRMMTPRLALRLRKLQKLAEKKNIGIHVVQAFTETSQNQSASTTLYHEGRAVKLTSNPSGQLGQLASLAVCAGFDAVSFTSSAFIEGFVKAQAGYSAVLASYFEGPSYATVSPLGVDDSEYRYPVSLSEESVVTRLLDGGVPPDTPVSQHFRLRDVTSSDRRYFRLDPSLLECLELAEEDFPGTIEVIRDSVYRTRSENVRRNMDLRHPEELWRYQAGQAVEVRPAGTLSSERLLALATSILRECPALVRLQMRAVGLGCHSDRLYVDLRPLVAGHERVYVMVWEGEEGEEVEGTGYCQYVRHLQRSMIEGGPVVQSMPDIACRDRGLDPGLEFLSFQFGQQGHCSVEGQEAFCSHSRADRQKAADDLKRLLTSAAGHGRLVSHVLHALVRDCLVDLCGGCAGVGPVFDQKVRACSRLVHYYARRAATPLPPDLTNTTAFYNTHARRSTLHELACGHGSVCVVNTPLHSLFAPTVTARYYPDHKKPLERPLFAADVNPTPLLELVSQELAFRAKGKVVVYIEAEGDVYALRNIIKVLMVHNQNVSLVEFHVAPTADTDLVTSSIQRKLEAWSGLACPRFSRFALTPFVVVAMDTERHRRSAELSIPRNKATAKIYDWELEWLDKMF